MSDQPCNSSQSQKNQGSITQEGCCSSGTQRQESPNQDMAKNKANPHNQPQNQSQNRQPVSQDQTRR